MGLCFEGVELQGSPKRGTDSWTIGSTLDSCETLDEGSGPGFIKGHSELIWDWGCICEISIRLYVCDTPFSIVIRRLKGGRRLEGK